MKVGKPGRVSIMIAHIHPASTLDTVQDFLCELDMKPNTGIPQFPRFRFPRF